MRPAVFLLASSVGVALGSARAEEGWPQFRGAGGASVAEADSLPTRWSGDENVAWKVELPGPGSSSPVVVGDRLFLTCYGGYGLDEKDPGREEELVRSVLCLSVEDGSLLWRRDLPAKQPESQYTDVLTSHGYATSTPVSDGERLYVFFGKSGVFAFDLDGKPIWEADIGWKLHYWGSGASPILLGDLLIVNAAIEKYSLTALNKHTGEEVWRAKNLTSSWCTPAVVEAPDGKRELVVSVLNRLLGIDPTTGEELWETETRGSYAAPSPIARDGVVYAVDTRPNRLLAIRSGGRGDITDSHILWTAQRVGSSVPSPTLYRGHVYTVDTGGVFSCVDSDDGSVKYLRRLPESPRFYASPVAADGKLYLVSRNGGTYVVASGEEFELLAHNRLPDDSTFNATPAVAHGSLFLRSDKFAWLLQAE